MTLAARTPLEQLQALTDAWLQAKAQEHQANAMRVAIEKDIVLLTGQRTTAGQITVTVPGVKIVVKTNMTSKFDWAKWDEDIASFIPPERHPVKNVRALDEAGVNWLRENDWKSYQLLATALTVTEGKPTISITKQT